MSVGRLLPMYGHDPEFDYGDDLATELAIERAVAREFPDGIEAYLATHPPKQGRPQSIEKHPGHPDQKVHGRKGKGSTDTIDAGPPAPATASGVKANLALAQVGLAARITNNHHKVVEDRLGENVMDGYGASDAGVELKKNAEAVIADHLLADPAAMAVVRQAGIERIRPGLDSSLEFARAEYAETARLLPEVNDLKRARSTDKEYLEGPEVAAALTESARSMAVTRGADPEGLTMSVKVVDRPGGPVIEITASKYNIHDEIDMATFQREVAGTSMFRTSGTSGSNPTSPVGQLNLIVERQAVSKVVHDDPDYPGDDTLMARKYARNATQDWASSAGDSAPRSLANQLAVADVFGLASSNIAGRETSKESMDAARTIYATEGAAQRAYVRAQYEATQRRLRDEGIGPDDPIVLYRGVGAGVIGNNVEPRYDSRVKNGDVVEVSSNPASSWATTSGAAGPFTQGGGGMLTAAIPSRLILGMPGSGWGCYDEAEVVVLGQLVPAAVFSPADIRR